MERVEGEEGEGGKGKERVKRQPESDLHLLGDKTKSTLGESP